MSLLHDLRSLAGKSFIYGIGSVVTRGIAFLLLPVYTRFLTPADYGITAIAGTVMAVLTVILPLGLYGSLMRFYFTAESEDARRETNGTIWLTIVASSLLLTIALHVTGDRWFTLLFPGIAFHPYGVLAVWTAFFNIINLLPPTLFQADERPSAYITATIINNVLNILLVIWFVVARRMGAYGYLLGGFVSTAVLFIPYLIISVRRIRLRMNWAWLKPALIFALPLVPHGIAGWILELSDRAILQRYVPLRDLGVYSLGYQIALPMSLFSTALNSAWIPFFYKRVQEQGEGAKAAIRPLVTYYTLTVTCAALVWALVSGDLVRLMVSPAFRGAAIIVPWVVAGYLFQALYYIPGNFLFVANRTGLVPIATGFAGIVNLGLNLWLAPKFGVIAACWSTLIAYAAMLLFVWAAALKTYPFPYDYRRLMTVMAFAIAIFFAGQLLTLHNAVADIVLKLALVATLPLLLAATRFFDVQETEAARALLMRWRRT